MPGHEPARYRSWSRILLTNTASHRSTSKRIALYISPTDPDSADAILHTLAFPVFFRWEGTEKFVALPQKASCRRLSREAACFAEKQLGHASQRGHCLSASHTEDLFTSAEYCLKWL